MIFHLWQLAVPPRPQGICFTCVRFAQHAEYFVGDCSHEWDQCFHIMSRACYRSHDQRTRFLWRDRIIHLNWADTGSAPLLYFKCQQCRLADRPLIHWSIYQMNWWVKCLLSKNRVTDALETSRMGSRYCKSSQFVLGQQRRNTLVEQMQIHLLFWYGPAKIALLMYCKIAALELSSRLWYVSPDRGWSSAAARTLLAQPSWKMHESEVLSVYLFGCISSKSTTQTTQKGRNQHIEYRVMSFVAFYCWNRLKIE